MSRDLANLQQRFEALSLVPVQGDGVLRPGHLELQAKASQVAALDLGTEAGRFALGQWAANMILGALHAPVKGRA